MAKLPRKKAEEMLDEAIQFQNDAIEKFQKLSTLMVTTAFYRDNQRSSRSLWNPYPPNHSEANETLNYIRPFVRSAVSDMLRNLPNPELYQRTATQQQCLRREQQVSSRIPFCVTA